ncbi:MAG: C4-dicarboxylate ABC transporter substrate-binding protein, partial [Pseudomonas sp.]|nr:C4-dicarboxylate ABC transporter substrate-binding protein [Pseudomonas sp.]
MRRILHDLKILILTNLWIVPVLAGLVGALFYFAAPPPPMHARMATGAVGGGYHAFGERLRAELELQGFTLELVESAGSEDNLNKLGSGEVELALVQSGQELTLSDEARGKLNGLGVMYREPLWLFLGDKVKFEQLSDLMKLRLAAEPKVRLVSLRRTEAYLARLPYLSQLQVGEGMLDMAHNSPDRDIVTLGPVATLVAGEEFHPSLTPLILEAAKT